MLTSATYKSMRSSMNSMYPKLQVTLKEASAHRINAKSQTCHFVRKMTSLVNKRPKYVM